MRALSVFLVLVLASLLASYVLWKNNKFLAWMFLSGGIALALFVLGVLVSRYFE